MMHKSMSDTTAFGTAIWRAVSVPTNTITFDSTTRKAAGVSIEMNLLLLLKVG